MTRFSDQLLDDLMREHGPTLAHTRLPAQPRRRVTARRMLLAGGTLAVAAAIAGTLAARNPAPAYAVTQNPDGTVTLTVRQTSGIAPANAALRQLFDNKVVVLPVKPGCPSLSSLPTPAAPGDLITMRIALSRSVTVNAKRIPARDIFVVGGQTFGHRAIAVGLLTSPPAPSCISIPAQIRNQLGLGNSGSNS